MQRERERESERGVKKTRNGATTKHHCSSYISSSPEINQPSVPPMKPELPECASGKPSSQNMTAVMKERGRGSEVQQRRKVCVTNGLPVSTRRECTHECVQEMAKSTMFFIMIVRTFLSCTVPASKKAKPDCMMKIRAHTVSVHIVSASPARNKSHGVSLP